VNTSHTAMGGVMVSRPARFPCELAFRNRRRSAHHHAAHRGVAGVHFFLNVLSTFGQPLVAPLAAFIDAHVPGARAYLADPGIRWVIAVIVALLALYSSARSRPR